MKPDITEYYSDLEVVIPPDLHVAAKRAFVRTTAQAYAATLSGGGITVAMLVSLIKEPDWVVIISTLVVALLTPFVAGLVAYLNIMSKGIPEAYSGVVTDIPPMAIELPYEPRHANAEEEDDADPFMETDQV